jgi:predicted MFS family arabinose efflux permease
MTARPPALRPGLSLLALTAGVAVIGSNQLALSPILLDVARSLSASPVEVSRATACYGGATALSALLLAPRIDRLGARRALLLGLAALVAATLASAAATGWVMLMAAQGLAGLGAGLALPASYALATIIAPAGQSARTLGRVLTGWSASLVAGVPLAALISDWVGWRFAFLLLAAVAALAALGTSGLPRDRAAPGLARGGGSPLAALAEPAVPPLLLICLAFMACFYGVYTFLGDHVRLAEGISAAHAGLVVLTYGGGFGLASLATAPVDRLGPHRVFPAVLLTVAAIYLALAETGGRLAPVALLTFAWGFANHFVLNILILLVSQARPQARGAALGLNSAVTYLGALVGIAGAGVVYQGAGFAALCRIAAALVAGAALLAALARARLVRAPPAG